MEAKDGLEEMGFVSRLFVPGGISCHIRLQEGGPEINTLVGKDHLEMGDCSSKGAALMISALSPGLPWKLYPNEAEALDAFEKSYT